MRGLLMSQCIRHASTPPEPAQRRAEGLDVVSEVLEDLRVGLAHKPGHARADLAHRRLGQVAEVIWRGQSGGRAGACAAGGGRARASGSGFELARRRGVHSSLPVKPFTPLAVALAVA